MPFGESAIPSLASLSLREQKLLEILVTSYLNGCSSSAEIETIIQAEGGLHSFFGGQIPNAHDIKVFRRNNRQSLTQALSIGLEGTATALHDCPGIQERANEILNFAVFIDSVTDPNC
jgi:hypothetical protein